MNKILRCRVGSMIYLFEPGDKMKYDKPYKTFGFIEAVQENYTVIAGSVARYSLLTLRETGNVILEAVNDPDIYFPTAFCNDKLFDYELQAYNSTTLV